SHLHSRLTCCVVASNSRQPDLLGPQALVARPSVKHGPVRDSRESLTPPKAEYTGADHLRPAAIRAGVILRPGQRFGFHNLRHSLSTLLITGQKSDVRTTQDILR